jgi:hypothetical protein
MMFQQKPIYERPDWAYMKTGDKTKWNPPWGDALRAFLSTTYHRGCGGRFREKGNEGLISMKVWVCCDRCGEQSYIRMEY